MRRTTLVNSMLGLAALAAAASGCGEWREILDKVRTGATTGTDGKGTSTGGGMGGSGQPTDPTTKCDVITDASGQQCKTCWDATGAVVASDCSPSATGAGGSGTPPPPDPIKCDVTTDSAGQVCKTCWDATGKVVASDCSPTSTGAGGSGAPPPPDPIKCDVTTDDSGQQCKTCWDATGVVVRRECPSSPTDSTICDVSTDASGQQCKTCWDGTGAVVAKECAPAPTGTGGSTGGGACIKIVDGGPTSCKDYATWKKYGTDRCAQEKLTLTDVITLTTCAGAIESVAYVCCPTR